MAFDSSGHAELVADNHLLITESGSGFGIDLDPNQDFTGQYFHLADTPGALQRVDEWIRHRLRALQLKQWKRGKTTYRELKRLGAAENVARQVAANTRRWWKNAAMHLHIALPTSYYDQRGVPRLAG